MTRKKTPKRRSSKSSKKFGRREFVSHVWRAMKAQERENPSLALLHRNLEGAVRLIGLTGGIASGKTTVAGFFREAGIPVIDADAIARAIVAPGKKAWREIVSAFGQGVVLPDRRLDREKIAGIVFHDESKRRLLETITHPEIFRQIGEKIRRLKKKARAIVIDAPLLFESGLFRMMHKNLLVRVRPEVQMKRLMARDSLTEAQAWPRILAQMPNPDKERLSDRIIDNSKTVAETRGQVRDLLKTL